MSGEASVSDQPEKMTHSNVKIIKTHCFRLFFQFGTFEIGICFEFGAFDIRISTLAFHERRLLFNQDRGHHRHSDPQQMAGICSLIKDDFDRDPLDDLDKVPCRILGRKEREG